MQRNLRRCAIAVCLAGCGVLWASDSPISAPDSTGSVTPVAGESWLSHIHRSFGDTSMGKTGRLGPPAPAPGVEPAGWQLGTLPSSGPKVSLHGSDFYRLNCQGCHGEAGLGAPPEIKSVIDPVRGTSAPIVMKRMKDRGADISATSAAELAKEAQAALLQRLHQGGRDMPAFPQLSEEEIRALIAYLKQLSDVPGSAQLTVAEPSIRVGEHIVKSTCHICHDATGPNPTPQQLEDGAIPPLETLTTRTDELEFIRKVTGGAPIIMGTPPTPHRGRMPVFYYLSPSEVADAYLYLISYPPSDLAAATPMMAGMTQVPSSNAPPPAAPNVPASPAGPVEQRYGSPRSEGITDLAVTISLVSLGAFVLALILGGLGFAAAEMVRLGCEAEHRNTRGSGFCNMQRTGGVEADGPKAEVPAAEIGIRAQRRTA